MKKNQKKYIYLIQSLNDGYYKIGTSVNPNKRIEQLQTSNSSKLKIINTYNSEFYNLIETALHNHYSHLKLNGEWFNFSINEEIEFEEKCEKFENKIKFLKEMNNNYFR